MPKKGDQIPMFPTAYPELRLCLGCRTKYEPVPELHEGGWCPTCGSQRWELAVKSDYRMVEPPEAQPEKPEPLPGSTEDYNDRED